MLHDHERYDGTGYPSGQRGAEIPLESRIIAVADAFEAMTGERPYHASLSPERALKSCRGTRVASSTEAAWTPSCRRSPGDAVVLRRSFSRA